MIFQLTDVVCVQVDLLNIDSIYRHMFGKRLRQVITEETNGFYRQMLLAILEP
jgi:hypothetical protein